MISTTAVIGAFGTLITIVVTLLIRNQSSLAKHQADTVSNLQMLETQFAQHREAVAATYPPRKEVKVELESLQTRVKDGFEKTERTLTNHNSEVTMQLREIRSDFRRVYEKLDTKQDK